MDLYFTGNSAFFRAISSTWEEYFFLPFSQLSEGHTFFLAPRLRGDSSLVGGFQKITRNTALLKGLGGVDKSVVIANVQHTAENGTSTFLMIPDNFPVIFLCPLSLTFLI